MKKTDLHRIFYCVALTLSSLFGASSWAQRSVDPMNPPFPSPALGNFPSPAMLSHCQPNPPLESPGTLVPRSSSDPHLLCKPLSRSFMLNRVVMELACKGSFVLWNRGTVHGARAGDPCAVGMTCCNWDDMPSLIYIPSLPFIE